MNLFYTPLLLSAVADAVSDAIFSLISVSHPINAAVLGTPAWVDSIFNSLQQSIASSIGGFFLGRQDAAEEFATTLTFIVFAIVGLYIIRRLITVSKIVWQMFHPIEKSAESGVEVPKHLRDRYKP